VTETLLFVLPNALGIVLSPLAVVAVILLLLTPRARVNGLAFLAGWVAGLAVVAGLTLLVTDEPGAAAQGQQALWTLVLRLAIGAGLLFLAYRSFRKRPRAGEEARLPGWMNAVGSFTPLRSFSVAAAFAAVKPKNLLLTVAAVIDVALADLSQAQAVAVVIGFVTLASIGVGAPVTYALAGGERARARLTRWSGWLQAHNAVMVAAVLAVLGVKVLLEGLSGL
jgi:threonine/homoserine/homoserine lactone efflux protein